MDRMWDKGEPDFPIVESRSYQQGWAPMIGRAASTVQAVFPSAHVDLASDPGRFSVTMDAADLEMLLCRLRHPSAQR